MSGGPFESVAAGGGARWFTRAAAAAVMSVLVWNGCSSGGPGGADGGLPDGGAPTGPSACSATGAACPEGTVCVNGACQATCAHAVCPAGTYCESAVPALAVCSSIVAHPCNYNS